MAKPCQRKMSVADMMTRHGSITEEIREEIKKTFALFDKDGDGFISNNEIADVFRLLGIDSSRTDIKSFLKTVDTDGNGSVDYQEFESFIKKSGFLQAIPDEDEPGMLEAFKMLDLDGNGFIEKEELQSFLNKFRGKNINADEIESMINDADSNGDGKIDFQEFKSRLALNM